jgi:hypothetical protein
LIVCSFQIISRLITCFGGKSYLLVGEVEDELDGLEKIWINNRLLSTRINRAPSDKMSGRPGHVLTHSTLFEILSSFSQSLTPSNVDS